MKIVPVAEFCGDEPRFLAKTEAASLLAAVEDWLRASDAEVTFDFGGAHGVSPSGARVFFFGVVRRFGESVVNRLTFPHTTPEIVHVLEAAVSDATERYAKL